ncbi:DUF1543 domain-containing protein [Candidatus Tisiphia endosymbiont of Ditula angustiorana]|uniref:DUF1543 domain-containing protein n=1 Tax=Candidatus Tisiphia endosymbiont of Ditula angustiorana TaxID=3066272 RepID=UPI00312C9646
MQQFQNFIFNTPKLGIFYLGGKIEGCSIEIHDVVFVVGKSNIDMSEQIRKKWIGSPNSLHIDSWFIAETVDGFNIRISETTPQTRKNRLFFVNLGSYKKNFFGEFHFMSLIVAESRHAAIEKAKINAPKNEEMQHCDNIYDIDECIRIDKIDNYYIVLDYTGIEQENTVINGYQKLNGSVAN